LRKISVFFIVFILGFGINTIAQNPYIRHFTAIDGLPTNTIYQIYQDSQKFIWFTSDAGVVKFDGSNFTSYRKKDGLSSNDVVRIKEDATGRIWLFNYNASVNYIQNNTVYNANNSPFLSLLKGRGFILDFFTDSDQTIHFYNWQREVFSLDTKSEVFKELLFNNTDKLPPSDRDSEGIKILYLTKNALNEWIIWSSIGVYKQHINNKSSLSIIDPELRAITVFPTGNNTFYVRTLKNDLIRVSGNFIKKKLFLPFDLVKIKTILEDSDGYVWIAAYDEGVYCLKNNTVIRHFNIKNALGLLQDHEKNIWISTQSDGIYAINHDLLKQNHFDRTNFNSYGVNKLCDAPGMGIWCTNTKSAFLLKNEVFYSLEVPKVIQPINIVYMFKDQTLLLGSISQLLCTYENLTFHKASSEIGHSTRKIHSVFTKKVINDRSGNLVAMFDQNKIKFTSRFNPAINLAYKQINERINNGYFNSNNDFVINAKQNYLYKNDKLEPYPVLSRFDGTIILDHLFLNDSAELFNIDGDSLFLLKNNTFYNLTNAFESPVDKQINKMLFEGTTLYMATLRDIYVCRNPLNAITGSTVNIEPLNISFNNINDIIIVRDTLYIASDDGLTIIAEASIGKNVPLPPIPYLRSITVNDDAYLMSDQELKLTGKNNIKLSFGCISYSSSPLIYSYKLEGSENSWTTGTGNGINLVYQNLPKGNYVFKLRVRKSNSGWSDPLELPITIKPTLTQHPAFWAFIVLLLSGLIFLIVSMIRIQKMKRVEVDHQLIVMEQKALQSMMNPHFIFNSLGSIQNYLLKNKGSEAVIYLSQFARLIRQNLNAINTPMIILEEEIDRLRNYIDLEKKRLDNKFEYSIEIDPKFEEEVVFIPGMIIQPITENAIWHGIATLEKKGFIKISFRAYKPKSLKIIIEDNGIGMKRSSEYAAKGSHHQRLGMQIIEKRLVLLNKKYGTETGINYSECNPSHPHPGTRVELILPFIYSLDEI
jgi:hypothetical protein